MKHFLCLFGCVLGIQAWASPLLLNELMEEAQGTPNHLAYRIYFGTDVKGTTETGKDFKAFPNRKCLLSVLVSAPPKSDVPRIKIEALLFLKSNKGLTSRPYEFSFDGPSLNQTIAAGFRRTQKDSGRGSDTQFFDSDLLTNVQTFPEHQETFFLRFYEGQPNVFRILEKRFQGDCIGLVEDPKHIEEFYERVRKQADQSPFDLMSPMELYRDWWDGKTD